MLSLSVFLPTMSVFVVVIDFQCISKFINDFLEIQKISQSKAFHSHEYE